MSCKKGKFPYSFFILLTQRHESFAPKLTNFHIFINPLPFNVPIFSKSPYLIAHIKIKYETGCIGRFSAKMDSFVALVSSFQPLTNFT